MEKTVDQVLAKHTRLHKGSGKRIFELQPEIDWNKGKALCWLLALAFLYQARMGLTIRKEREKVKPRSATISRHRRLGPLLVVMGVAGYCFGLILVYIDKG